MKQDTCSDIGSSSSEYLSKPDPLKRKTTGKQTLLEYSIRVCVMMRVV